MHLLLITVVVLLAGCVSPQYVENYTSGAKIGLVKYSYDSVFCHEHTGFTVFQNNKRAYDFEFDLDLELAELLKTVASENGHSSILIDDPSLVVPTTTLFKFSSWDGTPTLLEGSREKIDQITNKYNLDVIFFTAASEGPKSEKRCSVSYSTDSRVKSGVIYSKPYLIGFDAKTLKYLGMNMGTGGTAVASFYPKNIGALSKEDLNTLYPAIADGIRNGIRDMFKTVGLGEERYIEANF